MLNKYILAFLLFLPICGAESLNIEQQGINTSVISIDLECGRVGGIIREDCGYEGCSQPEDTCKHLCLCVSPYIISDSNYYTLHKILINHLEVSWYTYNNYISPVIDPTLKPPLYS